MAEDITFALDIGTRTIVGLLLKEEGSKYKILHSAVREHETRAMLDGQIHNVEKVAAEALQIKKELEEKSGLSLNKAAAAAAGRSLKTAVEKQSLQFEKSRYISREDIKKLELKAIKKAEAKLEKSAESELQPEYHFVGYTVINYRLDGMEIGELLGQRGRKLEVELVATFLPRIVIDSLLSVVEKIGLEVEHLTLEPIAAHNIVIPDSMSSFNLALVDIGAGTSDIAVTDAGSVSGYDMVPVAGDEITEVISEKFLIDYKSAEKIKCSLNKTELPKVKTILGEDILLQKEEVLNAAAEQLEEMSSKIAENILNINGKPPQAVIFIGGGSLFPGLKEKFAEKIDLVDSRIGIRRKEDLKNIDGEISGIDSAQSITPIGIGVITRETENKAVFIDLEVNGKMVKLLTFAEASVSEALLAADIDIDKITPRPGSGITASVNGELKVVKGEMGKRAALQINGGEAELDSKLKSGDSIKFTPAEAGRTAEALIKELIDDKDLVNYEIKINGSTDYVKTKIYQNGKTAYPEDEVLDGADITYQVPKTVEEGLAQLMEIDTSELRDSKIEFTFNGKKSQISDSGYKVSADGEDIDLKSSLKDGMSIKVEEKNLGNIKVRDFLNTQTGDEITFNFNGSKLKLPDSEWLIKANGEKVGLDYKIKEADELTAESRELTVEAVCRYINYDLSKKMKQKMEVELNGKEADFSASVKDGDELVFKLTG